MNPAGEVVYRPVRRVCRAVGSADRTGSCGLAPQPRQSWRWPWRTMKLGRNPAGTSRNTRSKVPFLTTRRPPHPAHRHPCSSRWT